MHPRLLVPLILMLVLTLVITPGVGLAQDGYEQLASRALSSLGTNCAATGVNQLCLAYDNVEVGFTGTAPTGFSGVPGDEAELTEVSSVQTTAANLTNSTLGMAVMYVKTTNIPGALTDLSAMFMMVGDVQVTNMVAPGEAFLPGALVDVTTSAQADLRAAPGADARVLGTVANGTLLQADAVSPGGAWVRVMYVDQIAWVSSELLGTAAGVETLPVVTRDSRTPMQVITLRTGGGTPPSLAIPPDVLAVQSPKDTTIEIWVNEIHLMINGTIFLRTLPDGRIQLLTAHGETTAYPGTSQEVGTVAGTSVLLGGGTWTEWQVLRQGDWDFYSFFEKLPTNIIIIIIILPDIITPSGIVPQPPVIVIIFDEGEITIIIPIPPPFVRIPVEFGDVGEDLDRLAWEPFEIGNAVCEPVLTLYHSNTTGDWDIYSLAENGLSEDGNNISHDATGPDVMPSYSQDGQWVVYATTRYMLGGWEIQASQINGPLEARVTFNSGTDINPVWGPGNLIAWESNGYGNWELNMLDVSADGMPIRLTEDAANDINPYWFPDGERLVFQSDRDGEWEVYELNVNTLAVTQLTDNDTEDMDPVISRDGSQMAWLQLDEFGVVNLWVMDLGTMEARQLTELGVDVSGPMFAPDDALIAFYADVDGDDDVFGVYLDTDTIVPVTENDDVEDRAPTFRCNEPRVVVYHSDQMSDDEHPSQFEIFEARIPVVGAPPAPPTRLTFDVDGIDLFAESDAHEERESKEGTVPVHP